MDLAMERADYMGFRDCQRKARQEGHLLGVGLCTFVELSGNGPSKGDWLTDFPTLMETGVVRVHPTGRVTAHCGTTDHGQDHETTYAPILSDELGIPVDGPLMRLDDDVYYGLGVLSANWVRYHVETGDWDVEVETEPRTSVHPGVLKDLTLSRNGVNRY